MICPLKENLKERPSGTGSGSSQVEQVPQVEGQAAETPFREQRCAVSLFPTHVQYLAIFTPPIKNLSRKEESAQLAGLLRLSLGDSEGLSLGESEYKLPPPHEQHASFAVLPKFLKSLP